MLRRIWIICLVTVLGFAASSASTLPLNTPDGTYKSVPVTSRAACVELCKQDEQCRGSTSFWTFINDVRQDEGVCHLNNGLSPASPFAITPPPPLDARQALNDINAYRARHGLNPLRLSAKLNAASEAHARDLAQHGIIAHEGTDGSTSGDRAKRQGYMFWALAENVASGQPSWDEAFIGWQNSPGHNANLLLPDVTELGVALAHDPTTRYVNYWTMLVGKPMDARYASQP